MSRGKPFEPGQSANPSGRPKGVPDRRSKLRRELERDGKAVLAKVVEAALAGDLQACRIVLDRILPTLRPVDSPQAVPVLGESLTELGRAIVAAAVSGAITADTAKVLTGAMASVARVEEVTELRERLERLELYFEKNPSQT